MPNTKPLNLELIKARDKARTQGRVAIRFGEGRANDAVPEDIMCNSCWRVHLVGTPPFQHRREIRARWGLVRFAVLSLARAL